MFLTLFGKQRDALPLYEKKSFFQADEMKFHLCLWRALPDCHIFPRIELGALMAPVCSQPRQRRAALARLHGRTVDYAVFDASFKLLFVIELMAPGPARDGSDPTAALLQSAGIKTIRWSLQQLPSAGQVIRTLKAFSSRGAGADVAQPSVGDATMRRAAPVSGAGRAPIARAASPARPACGLSQERVDELGAAGHIKAAFPRIWERICLFCDDPAYLGNYLDSLALQDREDGRAGFPPGVMAEIAAIQSANQRCLPATSNPVRKQAVASR
jgi:hypothetical protein